MEVVIILGGPEQVGLFGQRHGRVIHRHERDIGIAGDQRLHRVQDAGTRRLCGGEDGIDFSGGTHRLGEDAGVVATARSKFAHNHPGLDAGESDGLGRLAGRVAFLVGIRPAGIGDGGSNGGRHLLGKGRCAGGKQDDYGGGN